MKKKIVSLALAVCLIAIAAVGTLAYFTDTDKADNTFTVGNVDITLTEPKWDAEEHDDAYPGEALPKDPTVKNVGDNPCFVRISVTGLDCLGKDNMITYETGYVTGALGQDWVLGDDGYFYYTKVLAAGTPTTALFDQIRIPTSVTNGFDGNYDVVVTAQAVQAQGARPSWTDVQKMGVADIAAWFTTCMG